VRRLRRDPVFVVGLAVAVVALVIGLIWSVAAGEQQPAADVQAVDLQGVVDLREVDELRDVAGRRVTTTGAQVEDVPADEGFWVSAGGGERVWVQVDTAGESPFVVEPGARVSFTGQVVAHGPDFVVRPEFPAADADDLVDAGAHIEVDVADIRLG
jgi:hypothetical protein